MDHNNFVLDFREIDSDLIKMDLSNSERILSQRETENRKVLEMIYSAASHILNAHLEDHGHPLMEMHRFLIASHHHLASPQSDLITTFMQHHSLARHKEKCSAGDEARVFLRLSKHPFDMNRCNAKAVASLFDAFNVQVEFFDEDCCYQGAWLEAAQDALADFYERVRSASHQHRVNIIFAMQTSSDMDPVWKDELTKPEDGSGNLLNLHNLAQHNQAQQIVAQQTTVVNRPPFPSIKDLEGDNVFQVVSYLRSMIHLSLPIEVETWPSDVKTYFNNIWGYENQKTGDAKKEWQSLPSNELLLAWERSLPENFKSGGESKAKQFEALLQLKGLSIDFSKPLAAESRDFIHTVTGWQLKFEQLQRDDHVSADSQKFLSKLMLKSMKYKGIAEKSRNIITNDVKRAVGTTEDFCVVLNTIQDVVMAQVKILQRAYDFIPQNQGSYQNDGKAKNPNKRKIGEDSKEGNSPRAKPPNICPGCGYDKKPTPINSSGVMHPQCPRNDRKGCAKDPRRNNTQLLWHESIVGKAWKEFGYNALPKDESVTLANAKEKRFKPTTEGNYTFMINHCNDLLLKNELIPFLLPYVQARKLERSGELRNLKAPAPGSAPTGTLLLDSGAIGSSVVSESFFNYILASNSSYVLHDTCHELNTAMNHNTISNKEISFNIYLTSELKATTSTILLPIRAIVAPISVDLIVDKLTIKKHNLLKYFPSHFAEGELLDWLRQIPEPVEEKEGYNSPQSPSKETIILDYILDRKKNASILHHLWVQEQRDDRAAREAIYSVGNKPITYLATMSSSAHKRKQCDSDTSTFLANMISNFSMKSAFERDGNLTGIPDNKLESIPAELVSDVHSENEYKRVSVEGSPLVQSALESLVAEFPEIFKATVQGNPAKLIPFKLEVDTKKWQQPKNMLRCRKLDRERERELGDFIKILLDANVIEACNAAYYSHAFLVPKPNGKWRLVLDFKNLNGATINYYKWPLPDIKEMLSRVGDSRPEFFAVFDLTSGYYQAEIDEESRDFTAFLTKHGIFRWLRLPMGLTGACSYFQKSLVTQVLNGLMHDGCELYLDDCMIHAPTLDIFLKRLRSVFQRFRDNNITLNPLKCKIGLSQVEYVGHTINKDGLHFTRDKLDSVLNFPRPQTKRQIKSFLGLANYFRDHIANHSLRAQPLQDLVNAYDKTQARHRIVWTPECVAAFEDLRQAIDECPMLWFMNDYSPIFLQTDASDYGIGAYLYQLITNEDGSMVEHPIGFISKSIASEHQSWDTPMKEGYAIFYALQKWEYLLKDRQFTIKTDHKNLTRLRADHDSNKMVKRWFMSYQEYDILAWEYVKGNDNEIPDGFSRLCKMEDDVHPASSLFQLTGYEIPSEHWDTIARFHNSGLTGDGPGGHGGVQRTLQQLDDAGLQWRHRTKHVRRFIRLCPCCQKMAQMKSVIHSYPFTVSTYGLWDTVSVDYIERLVPDKYGNNMIIVIIDNFSRFTDLHPCSSTAAEGAADALLNFCGRYVTPLHFTTDSGSNFKSNLTSSLLERLGSDHFLTTAYSKEQNALVERQNKEVLRHLRNIIFDKRVADKWSKYCPIVQRLLNTLRNSATGLTPAEIVFPNGIQLDRSLLTESSSFFVSMYIHDMQEAQARIIALAEQSLREKDKEHMDNYSPLRTVFDDGSYVLVEHRHNSLRRGPKSKLLPFLRGPMLVKGHNKEGIYVLQDIVTEEVHNYHMSQLRPFLLDERNGPPLRTAVTDTLDEFVAEKVIRMRGDTRGSRKNLVFRIRWAGYGEADDTWEPWEHCKDSSAVQKFLRAHPEKRVQRLSKPVEAAEVQDTRNASDSDISDEDR